MIEDEAIDIPCDDCGAEIPKTISWLEFNKQLSCSCGAIVDIDLKALLKEIAEAERDAKKAFDLFYRLDV